MSNIILFFPKSEEKDTVLLPASVLMVAAPLIKKGYKVKIIDQRTDKRWREILLKEIKKKPLVFGVSALTGKQILNGLEASKLVKKNSNIPVVWGGVHASLLPEQTLENEYIDFVVIGEGEKTFLELIENLEKKDFFEKIKGLAFKKDDRIFINPQREFIDLDKSSEIPYHLIDVEKYISKKSFASGRVARNIALYTSRGCPHRCGFCYNKEFNKRKWRGKSAERVVEEIKHLIKKYNINAFEIEDDEFFVDMERAKKISQLIVKENLNIEIFTTCRVNYIANNINDEYLNLLYQAGFRMLAFGVESGSRKILDLMCKDITIDQVFETIKRLKRACINSKYYFMAGFPGETINDLYETTNLIQKMKQLDPQIRIPNWRIVTPFPGTELYIESLKHGFVPPKSLQGWADFSFQTFKTPWVNLKHKRIIKNVIFLIEYLEMSKTVGRGIFFKLAKLFGKLVDWRWKNHWFSFVPEKYIVNFVLKFKKSIIKIK